MLAAPGGCWLVSSLRGPDQSCDLFGLLPLWGYCSVSIGTLAGSLPECRLGARPAWGDAAEAAEGSPCRGAVGRRCVGWVGGVHRVKVRVPGGSGGDAGQGLSLSLSLLMHLPAAPKAVQHEQDQTHPGGLAWERRLLAPSVRTAASAGRCVVTLELPCQSPFPLPSPSPLPPCPSRSLCDALRLGSGSAASCRPGCPQHKAFLRRWIPLGFKGESRTKNRSL